MSDAHKAMRVAIDSFQVPSRLHKCKAEELPEGMDLLLRLVSGDEAAKFEVSTVSGRSMETVGAAAEFFVEQVLFSKNSDAYRVLGSTRGAPLELLRRNMNMLAKWSHPNGTKEGQHHYPALRLTEAWNHLKTPERRAEYDRQLDQLLAKGMISSKTHSSYKVPNKALMFGGELHAASVRRVHNAPKHRQMNKWRRVLFWFWSHFFRSPRPR